jgi:predicted transcriptional regulator
MPYLLLHTENPGNPTADALLTAATTAKVALTSEQAAAIVAALPSASPVQVAALRGSKAEVQQRLNSAADKDSSRWEVLEVSRAVVPTAKSLSPEFTV